MQYLGIYVVMIVKYCLYCLAGILGFIGVLLAASAIPSRDVKKITVGMALVFIATCCGLASLGMTCWGIYKDRDFPTPWWGWLITALVSDC